ncbi:MAG: hypothetical protein HUK40_19420 [Desulfobacter sp.]|nr:hypothetical protein [Desulfobacter sp.]WDP86164.1 MAG: hypothetical protein HUN05_14375 [Desulfobacter sp.]
MKKVGLRIIGIGVFHMVLYAYLVPFVIYPKFGNQGMTFAFVLAVIVSITVLGTLWIGKDKNKNKGE